MTKTYINGRFLAQPLSGMQRFAGELTTALDAHLSETDLDFGRSDVFEVLIPRGTAVRYQWRNVRTYEVGRLHGHAWEQIELAWAARDGILVNLTSSGPLLHARSVVVLHDAAVFEFPEHFAKGYRTWHRSLRPRLARQAKRLLTISEFSRRELARWCRVPESAFSIIGDSAEHIENVVADTRVLSRHGLTPGAYVLTVGNQSPNKNVALAIEAFRRSAPPGYLLAVAGAGDSRVFGTTQVVQDDCVRRLGRVSDEELKALYQNAALFLFPSRYEGFGVPPLEAMILGCPVLSSDASAMLEVLGDAARFFPSNDVDACSQEIRSLLNSRLCRSELVAKGRDRARRYSWRKSAATLLSILDSVKLEAAVGECS